MNTWQTYRCNLCRKVTKGSPEYQGTMCPLCETGQLYRVEGREEA